jgi:flagellar M-ring protein FliF
MVHETRLSLAAQGLPVGSGIGFEIFDTQRFGESEFVEQVQYLRALEGELSRTIGALDGVESARVHLVLPERTLIGGHGRSARASIVVAMRGLRRLREDQVRGIVHLVAGSVRDLEPSNVTVVDGEGRRLSSDESEEEEAGGAADDAETLRERIARGRERAIQEMLDETLGPGAAVVRLSAEVSFTREEHLEERYDPEAIATRSFELTSEGADPSATGTTAGIAGAVSALPGGPGPEATTTPVGEGGRRTEVRNFEVTKTVHRAVEPVGRVTRLSVAVLIDGHWEGEGAERHFVGRPDEELARIRSVVASAAGIREDRGDTLSVECVPFVVPPTEDAAAVAAAAAQGTTTLVGVGALVVLAVVAGAWLFVRRRRSQREAAEKAALALAEPANDKSDSEPDAAKQDESSSALATADADDPDSVRVRVIDFARRDPELAARVVRAWLAADATPASSATADAAETPEAA